MKRPTAAELHRISEKVIQWAGREGHAVFTLRDLIVIQWSLGLAEGGGRSKRRKKGTG